MTTSPSFRAELGLKEKWKMRRPGFEPRFARWQRAVIATILSALVHAPALAAVSKPGGLFVPFNSYGTWSYSSRSVILSEPGEGRVK